MQLKDHYTKPINSKRSDEQMSEARYYDLSFEINPPNIKSDVETITLYRDYSFDENNIMGNSDREEQIRKEMVATSAALIYNRLNALTNKSN